MTNIQDISLYVLSVIASVAIIVLGLFINYYNVFNPLGVVIALIGVSVIIYDIAILIPVKQIINHLLDMAK